MVCEANTVTVMFEIRHLMECDAENAMLTRVQMTYRRTQHGTHSAKHGALVVACMYYRGRTVHASC
jgi:hypothetical protein